jgi:hypothetical protein
MSLAILLTMSMVLWARSNTILRKCLQEHQAQIKHLSHLMFGTMICQNLIKTPMMSNWRILIQIPRTKTYMTMMSPPSLIIMILMMMMMMNPQPSFSTRFIVVVELIAATVRMMKVMSMNTSLFSLFPRTSNGSLSTQFSITVCPNLMSTMSGGSAPMI